MKTYTFVPTGTRALEFEKFNPALGNLTSIVIQTNVEKTGGSLYVDNDDANGASGNITQTVTITLTSPTVANGGVRLTDGDFQAIGSGISAVSSYSVELGPDDGDGPGVQTGGPDYGGTDFSPVSVASSGNVSSFVFSDYQGTTKFLVNVNGVQSVDTSVANGGAGVFTPASVAGDVTITYTYDAIPEPSAALLGMIGVVGLFIRRRR
jgi:hypothetical protein